MQIQRLLCLLNSNKKRLQQITCHNEDDFKKAMDNYSLSLGSNTFYIFSLNLSFSQAQIGGGIFLVEGYKANDKYEFQRVTSYAEQGTRKLQRSKFDGAWNLFS